jgi:hypothetical protein
MARFETLVVAKSNEVSITPAKRPIKNRKCAMTPRGSRLVYSCFRAVSVTPFLHKKWLRGMSGDAPIIDAEGYVSGMTLNSISVSAGGKL